MSALRGWEWDTLGQASQMRWMATNVQSYYNSLYPAQHELESADNDDTQRQTDTETETLLRTHYLSRVEGYKDKEG